MILTLPLNLEYLKNRYKMGDKEINLLMKKVLPTLVKRLTSDDQVEKIEIFTDTGFNIDIGFSSKIVITKSFTENLTKGEDVIESYIKSKKCKQDVIVMYNPLFPFISIKKLKIVFDRVCRGEINSAIGAYHSAQGVYDQIAAKNIDKGIFSVINMSKFIEQKSRIITPIEIVGLSALELVSLRLEEDYDLYGLIINSGLA